MRGYEVVFMKSAGVGGTFRIPMRGYEILNADVRVNTLAVPNPHEGL